MEWQAESPYPLSPPPPPTASRSTSHTRGSTCDSCRTHTDPSNHPKPTADIRVTLGVCILGFEQRYSDKRPSLQPHRAPSLPWTPLCRTAPPSHLPPHQPLARVAFFTICPSSDWAIVKLEISNSPFIKAFCPGSISWLRHALQTA